MSTTTVGHMPSEATGVERPPETGAGADTRAKNGAKHEAEYQNFVIRLRDFGPGGMRVEVVDSPVGRLRVPDLVPLDPEVFQFLERFHDPHGEGQLSRDELIGFGEILGDMLFPPRVRRMLNRTMEHLKEAERDLKKRRIRLLLQIDDPFLSTIPWEYVYVFEYGRRREHELWMEEQRRRLVQSGNGVGNASRGSKELAAILSNSAQLGFLARDPRISIVRHESFRNDVDCRATGHVVEGGDGAPAHKREQWNVLVAAAEPDDLARLAEDAGLDEPLRVQEEREAIEVTINDLGRGLEKDKRPFRSVGKSGEHRKKGEYDEDAHKSWKSQLRLDKLEKICEQEGNIHIFHFAGHGGFFRESMVDDVTEQLTDAALHKLLVLAQRRGERNLFVADRAPFIDRRPFIDRAPFIDRRPFIDRAPFIDRRPFIDRAPFIDRRPFIDRHLGCGRVMDANGIQRGAIVLTQSPKAVRKARKRAQGGTLDGPDPYEFLKTMQARPDLTYAQYTYERVEREEIPPKPLTPVDARHPHHVVWSDRIAAALKKANVRIAVVSACESGMRSPLGLPQILRPGGMAPALLAAGIDVVIGMQFVINDDRAHDFAQSFYKALAEGLCLEEAVAFGRKVIRERKEDQRDQDWGVPVVYSRLANPDIIHLRPGFSAPPVDDEQPVKDQLYAEFNSPTVLSYIQDLTERARNGNEPAQQAVEDVVVRSATFYSDRPAEALQLLSLVEDQGLVPRPAPKIDALRRELEAKLG